MPEPGAHLRIQVPRCLGRAGVHGRSDSHRLWRLSGRLRSPHRRSRSTAASRKSVARRWRCLKTGRQPAKARQRASCSGPWAIRTPCSYALAARAHQRCGCSRCAQCRRAAASTASSPGRQKHRAFAQARRVCSPRDAVDDCRWNADPHVSKLTFEITSVTWPTLSPRPMTHSLRQCGSPPSHEDRRRADWRSPERVAAA